MSLCFFGLYRSIPFSLPVNAFRHIQKEGIQPFKASKRSSALQLKSSLFFVPSFSCLYFRHQKVRNVRFTCLTMRARSKASCRLFHWCLELLRQSLLPDCALRPNFGSSLTLTLWFFISLSLSLSFWYSSLRLNNVPFIAKNRPVERVVLSTYFYSPRTYSELLSTQPTNRKRVYSYIIYHLGDTSSSFYLFLFPSPFSVNKLAFRAPLCSSGVSNIKYALNLYTKKKTGFNT